MGLEVLIIVVAVACAIGLTATGYWRLAFAPFTIRRGQMTVKRLGLRVESADDVERVNTILGTFAGGFNVMLTAPSESAWRAHLESLPTLYRPFGEEGVAMGFIPRQLFRFDAERFEEQLVKAGPEFRYLYYVGLGFWSGMRNHKPQKLIRIAERLDPLHRLLCFDGYGFKVAFFDHPKDKDALRRLDAFPGYARHAAYQGVGRAFFFRFMADRERLIREIDALGDCAADAAAGFGLAAAFVNPDRLEVGRGLAAAMPEAWRDHVHLGLCFGLKARAINDLTQFEHDLSALPSDIQHAVSASIRECDRVELLIRDELRNELHDERRAPNTTEPRTECNPDLSGVRANVRARRPADRPADDQYGNGYKRWRQRVTDWMAENIEYPLAGVRGQKRGECRTPSSGAVSTSVHFGGRRS